MIAKAFASDDPLARSQGIDEAAFYDLIDSLYDDFVGGGLSQVAIDPNLDRVAAVILAEPHNAAGDDEGSNAIAALIAEARMRYFTRYSPAFDDLMHIHFIASSPDYRRQQLVRRLLETCLDRARQQGYRMAMVEASGIRSRGLLQKHLGFEERVRIDYASFEWGGGLPFEAIAEHGGLALMDRKL